MARPLDTTVTVKAVTNDRIQIEFGGFTMEVDKANLAERMSGALDQTEVVLNNIALALALAGVNIEDDVAIKREVERRTYKMIR